ncbi:MAG: DUF2141 domain-containing protein [Bacteroidota bacterium]|nr:DUF2141 domain-containing protein [Bacteroidota bacterium]MDP4216558.1 DUF2141 domain-containing protein [Bacteroidota bacterium]MDP4245022.1 DUF2141 domain-containing protein [Bacteroidota bacterium]MDP4252857.1 DUF2141 domain-containing protein [Bacteroidota bacterium]MDP4259849.1 DUF2141 domain-containing protein [Bacteroidota bacterium]
MRHVYITSLVALLFATGMSSNRQYTITVHITGLRSDKGTLYLSLYHSARGYPRDTSAAFRLSAAPISNSKATVILEAIPEGVYAMACFHDENSNRKLDGNLFGIPTEGTGASNNARGSWGPPRFRDAAFTLSNDTTLTIKMVY